MNNAVFGKTMENVRKHKGIRLFTTGRKRNYLESKPNYHTTKNLLSVEMTIDSIYKDIAEDAESRWHTSNYELDRPMLKGKNKKVIGLMKDELVGKIMKKFVRLRAKTYIYLINDSNENKKAKSTKKYVIKKTLVWKLYKWFRSTSTW